MMTVIKSVVSSDEEALLGIIQLHNNGEPFQLDPTYSKGAFYRGEVPQPKWKYDLHPEPGVKQADCRKLPFKAGTVGSILFDPPMMWGAHGTNNPNNRIKRGYSDPTTLNIRFSQFASFEELRSMYQDSLTEFARILRPKGVLVFKCCDYTDKKSTFTHCLTWQWAQEIGFYARDWFVKIRSAGKAYNPKLTQRHAVKFHACFWVFVKA